MMRLKVKLIDQWAKMPEKAGEFEAGIDLFASWPCKVRRGQVAKVKTGIALEIPEGYFAHICDRSGLASRGFTCVGGIVDSSYRGEVIVLLAYLSSHDNPDHEYHVQSGDKIAQLVILPVPRVTIVEAKDLAGSLRGCRGFGSTDAKPLEVA